jgi:hypothetical protein
MNHTAYMACIIILLVFATYVSLLFLFCKNDQNNAECLFHRLLALIVLLIVVYLAVHRDTFVPFIGETVFPFILVKENTFTNSNGAISKTINVDAPDGTKVAYWASMPDSKVVPTPQVAYDNYENSGVTTVKKGQATLTVSCPSQYKIPPFNKKLEKHIHYRIIHTNGMISEIHTVKVAC